METELNTYEKQLSCEYKGRTYLVRDNGAVCRLPKEGNRITNLDNLWTFGKKNKDAYMVFTGNIRVHQIVCTAFHGEPSEQGLVVDHKDTNRCNNRPDNLRWVTRLENVLNNEITRKKIIFHCGSIKAFLDNPSLLKDAYLGPNYDWMKTVTKKEAEKSKRNLERWAQEPSNPNPRHQCQKGDIVYNESVDPQPTTKKEPETYYVDSLTEGSKQANWKTPTAFLLSPKEKRDNPIKQYYSNIKKSKAFSKNKFTTGRVVDFGYRENEEAIIVLTHHKSGVKEWALSKITYNGSSFVHENLGSFFDKKGGEKYFTLAMGREWTGGDCIDDYC